MFKIHSVISDVELEEELVKWLKSRNVDQKFAYMGQWAMIHYASTSTNKRSFDSAIFMDDGVNQFYDLTVKKKKEKENISHGTEFYAKFLIDNKIRSLTPIAIISLGCGNAEKEKELLLQLQRKGKSIVYYGIDASKEMLDLAHDMLQDLSIEKHFIHADITAKKCMTEIINMTKRYKVRVFAFLWWTFANPNQTQLVETLYALLSKNDILRFDVRVATHMTEEKEKLLYDHFLGYYENPNTVKSILYALEMAGVNIENWIPKVACAKEKQIGALQYKFYFLFTEKTVLTYKDTTMVFLPWETIPVMNIRVYEPGILEEFLQQHGFKKIWFTEKEANPLFANAQFLFRKEGLENEAEEFI